MGGINCIDGNFNPRPPRGGRHCLSSGSTTHRMISIHALREEGDYQGVRFAPELEHFNPRPPRGGRPSISTRQQQMHKISIHALREEGDLGYGSCGHSTSNFNPRPPRGGRRTTIRSRKRGNYFNPRPPRGGRRRAENRNGHTDRFQSTPSARRATEWTTDVLTLAAKFQSTPSARRATETVDEGEDNGDISIHALREEGDT